MVDLIVTYSVFVASYFQKIIKKYCLAYMTRFSAKNKNAERRENLVYSNCYLDDVFI